MGGDCAIRHGPEGMQMVQSFMPLHVLESRERKFVRTSG